MPKRSRALGRPPRSSVPSSPRTVSSTRGLAPADALRPVLSDADVGRVRRCGARADRLVRYSLLYEPQHGRGAGGLRPGLSVCRSRACSGTPTSRRTRHSGWSHRRQEPRHGPRLFDQRVRHGLRDANRGVASRRPISSGSLGREGLFGATMWPLQTVAKSTTLLSTRKLASTGSTCSTSSPS
jgi:hypothetical protein